MQNEILGTSNLERLLSRSDLLHPCISKNDKGLSWDGYIDVYQSGRNKQPKSNWLYQVPVQVKGHKGVNQSEKPDRYNIELSDLRIYRERGGTLFFKVSFDNAGKNEMFFYKALLPGDISELLKTAPGQKTTCVQLDPFPTDIVTVESILTAFAKAMKAHTEGSTLRWVDFDPVFNVSRKNPPSVSVAQKDPYSYNADILPLLGREAELKQLRDFLADDRPFCWWAIVGPGGSGKTRLVYEFQKELEEERHWTVDKLGPSQMNDLPKLSQEEFLNSQPGPTLLIMDYAQQFSTQLSKWLNRLTADDWRWNPDAPLRLLLLERADKDVNGEYPWEKDLLENTDSYRLSRTRFSDILELLSDEDLLSQVIERFATYLCQKDESLPVMTRTEAKALSAQLHSTEEKTRTPLFAMLLTEATLYKSLQNDWSPETLLDFHIDREKRLLEGRLREVAKGNRLLRNAVFELRRVATVLGTAGDPEWEVLRTLLPDCAKQIHRAAETAMWPEEELLQALDVMDGTGERIHSLRPDLFGEYMVLDWLRKGNHTKGEINRFFATILSLPDASTTFFLRVLRDFLNIIRNPNGGYHEWLIPVGMAFDDSQTAALIGLLFTLFDGAPVDSAPILSKKQKELVFAKEESTRAWILKRMVEYVKAFQDDTVEAESAYSNIASIYMEMGDYQKALEYYDKVQKIDETVLGLEHSQTAVTYNGIALVYFSMGNYTEALEYYGKARKIEENVLGPEHPNTLITYDNIGNVYRDLGDYQKALEYYDKELMRLETVFGINNKSTATVYNNLAIVYDALGDYQKALEYYEKAQKIHLIVLGPEHPDTASTYHNIGCVYLNMGDYTTALENFEKAQKIEETVLGMAHPEIASTYCQIANSYRIKGDYSKALEYHHKALKIQETVLGPENIATASTYNGIGYVYESMGDYQKALEYFEKALKIQENVYRSGHEYTGSTYNGIACVYKKLGEYKKALKYFDKALKMQKAVLGLEHNNASTIYNGISSVYHAMGDYQKALEYEKKAIKIAERVLGLGHLNTATLYNNIACIYREMGKYLKAIEYFDKAVRIRKKVLGDENLSTVDIYNSIAEVYLTMGNYSKALEYYLMVQKLMETVLGLEHSYTGITYTHISIVYRAMNDYQKALEYYYKVQKIQEKIYGIEDPDTAMVYHNLAVMHFEAHNLRDALRYSNLAEETIQRILGPEQPLTQVITQFNVILKRLSSSPETLGDDV